MRFIFSILIAAALYSLTACAGGVSTITQPNPPSFDGGGATDNNNDDGAMWWGSRFDQGALAAGDGYIDRIDSSVLRDASSIKEASGSGGKRDAKIVVDSATVPGKDRGVTKPDSAPPLVSACTVNAEVVQTYGADMVICQSTNFSTADQCHAEAAFCNISGGWQMCTGSEFATRGGQANSSLYVAWIKACVADLYSLSTIDTICSGCTHISGTSITARSCSSTKSVSFNIRNIGATTNDECWNFSSLKAYWGGTSPDYKTGSAVCCKK